VSIKRRSTFVRSEPTDVSATGCPNKTATAGIAVAGCAVSGRTVGSSVDIPKSTFNQENTIG